MLFENYRNQREKGENAEEDHTGPGKGVCAGRELMQGLSSLDGHERRWRHAWNQRIALLITSCHITLQLLYHGGRRQRLLIGQHRFDSPCAILFVPDFAKKKWMNLLKLKKNDILTEKSADEEVLEGDTNDGRRDIDEPVGKERSDAQEDYVVQQTVSMFINLRHTKKITAT